MSHHHAALSETTLFGIRLCAGDLQTAVDTIAEHAQLGAGGLVCVANVDMVTRAKRTPRLAQLMQGARVVVTDGMPLVWALRKLKGLNQTQRVDGPNLTLALCKRAAEQGIGVFFCGGSPTELKLLQHNLSIQFPRLRIVGAVSPPLLAAEPPFDVAITAQINQSGAGLVFVGLGCPKQEFWMDTHQAALKPVAIGVGLVFALIAGTQTRAPEWMRSAGLEWLFRLGQEPGRLWKRYLIGNSLFIWYLLNEYLRPAKPGNSK